MNPIIAIVIPTYKRPDTLERLLRSVARDIEGRTDTVVIVADNDAARSAEMIVNSISSELDMPIDYTVAPDPGVSNARNAGMARVRSRYVLFLDDDMEVVPPYLQPLLDTSKALGSALTFAPAVAALPNGSEGMEEWLAPLFSRVLTGETRLVKKTLGTGGCLVDLKGIDLPSPIFDPAMNETGGEDDAFFHHVTGQGGTIGWCADTKAWEHVPPHRATAGLCLASSFRLWSGTDAGGRRKRRQRSIRHRQMDDRRFCADPAARLTVYAVHSALRRPSRIEHLGRLAQGLGKVFWWDGLNARASTEPAPNRLQCGRGQVRVTSSRRKALRRRGLVVWGEPP